MVAVVVVIVIIIAIVVVSYRDREVLTCWIMIVNNHDPCSEVWAQGDLRRDSCGSGPAGSNGVRGGAENATTYW